MWACVNVFDCSSLYSVSAGRKFHESTPRSEGTAWRTACLLIALATLLTTTLSARQDPEPSPGPRASSRTASWQHLLRRDAGPVVVPDHLAEGHVLIDSGVEAERRRDPREHQDARLQHPRRPVILTTQAHYDHVAAHARLKKESGARVLVAAADAPLRRGGRRGRLPVRRRNITFRPPRSTPRSRDGEVVRVGDTALTAHLTPGHTKGDTTWTMTVKDAAGHDRQVVFLGSTSVNPGTRLVNNEQVSGASKRTTSAPSKSQKALTCEVFLAAHGSAFNGPAKAAAAAARQRGRGVHRSARLPGGHRAIGEGLPGGAGEAAQRGAPPRSGA